MQKEIIDYGEINVPTSWNEINLKTYQELERFYSDKDESFDIRKVLHILTNKTEDEINMLPIEFVEKIMEKLEFLKTLVTVQEPTDKVVISGETYMINFMEKLKFGEYVATDSVIRNDPHNYAAILAILCRKEGEPYDSKFEAEIFDKRMKMWEEQPITLVIRLVNFFLTLYIKSEIPSKLYTMAEEALDLTAQSINNSPKIGASKKLYFKWQVMKLRKLLKSSNNTSQMRLHSLPILSKKGKWKKKRINFKKH